MKGPISNTPPTVRRPIYVEQATLFALLIRELAGAWRTQRTQSFRDLPEYGRLIHGAYACGFVCRDIDGAALAERMTAMTGEPDCLRHADFSTIRRYIHTMMRAERHADAGTDFGGGFIFEAIRSGALDIVAERLEKDFGWRSE